MSSMMLKRRGFIFAAPAIVAASTLMPISAKFVAPLLMPWQREVLYRIEGLDEYNNRITAILRDPGKAHGFVRTHRTFRCITSLVVV